MSSMSFHIKFLVIVNLALVPFSTVKRFRRSNVTGIKFRSFQSIRKRNSFIESIYPFRTDGGGKYTRSKSPNIFNRKTIEVSTPAVSKQNAPSQKLPQRARTASMPGENRKVTKEVFLLNV